MPLALVTGGAGFIGSGVCRLLLKEGWSVRVLDDLSTGLRSNVPSDADLVVGDIRDRDVVLQAVQGTDAVFHLAAFTVLSESLSRMSECCDINVVGTANLVEAVAKFGPKRFVFSSSSAVYSQVSRDAIGEDHATSPASVYGQTKLQGEALLSVATENFGLQAVCLRYFNVYGPGQAANGAYPSVMPAFFTRIQEQRPLLIHGDGLQTRDFVYVEDVARANLLTATTPVARGEIKRLNIGTGLATSVMDLAHTINRITDRPEGYLEHDEPIAGEEWFSLARVTMAADELGWRVSTRLEEGLGQTWRCWSSVVATHGIKA